MKIKSVAAGFFASILFSGCVTTAPKTGWIQRDANTNKGIYVFSDGSRYEGGYLGDKFHGNGSFFYNYKYYGDYPSTTDAPQIDGATSSAKFNNGSIDGESITFTSNSEAQNNKVSPDSFKYVGGYSKGFKGAGTVTFGNGRVVKGQFGNESVPYTIAPNDRIIFKSSNLIGSYFEGPVSVKWPNGATFEGNSYRYYLFDRSSGMSNPNNLSCISSVFFGYGTLKSPGQPNYVGIVSEDYATYLPRRAREADLVRYAEELSECPSILAAARKSITNAQANYDAEMAQGREQARASLARDLSKLSVNINNDMRRVESASRGSTIDIDKEKARRNTVFNDARANFEKNNRTNAASKATIYSIKSPATTERSAPQGSRKSGGDATINETAAHKKSDVANKVSNNNKSDKKLSKEEKGGRSSPPLIILRSVTNEVRPEMPRESFTPPDTTQDLSKLLTDSQSSNNSTRAKKGQVMAR